MNSYYSGDSDSYFEESRTAMKSKADVTVKQIVDTFKDSIEDSHYMVKRPTAKKIGYVEKQD